MMILTITHNSKDLSLRMGDFNGAPREIDFSLGEVFVGYYKPLKQLYFEVESEEGKIESELELMYFNGSEFVTDAEVLDETFGLSVSGNVSWDNSRHKETTINGKKLFWIKLSPKDKSVAFIHGLNISLSSDKDLIPFFPSLFSYLPDGRKSFIGFHQEARNIIVQTIRNSGKTISSNTKVIPKSVDALDLVNIDEFKQASKYLTFHMIFDWLARDGDDRYAVKSASYYGKYQQSLKSQLVGIDTNDNGMDDDTPTPSNKTLTVIYE